MTKIFDTSIRIEVRLFFIFAWTASIANTVGFLSNLIFYGMTLDTIFYGICAIFMIVIGAVGHGERYVRTSSAIILIIINIVEFPLMYYLYGPGRGVYMILGILGIVIFVKKNWRQFWCVIAVIYDIFVMSISVVYPSSYLEITQESDLGASVVSFIIVAICLILLIILIIRQYERQNEELLEMTEELKDMAHKDPLTHLYNRRYLTDYLEPLMAENESSFSVVLMDLDNFKAVNDSYGHVYGDEVLQNFAKCMMNVVTEDGMAARFGGEEFMLVFRTIDETQIETKMKQIRTEFDQFSMASKGIHLTFSGGVEIFQNEDRITQLFNAADEKLYEAKKQGKNQVQF